MKQTNSWKAAIKAAFPHTIPILAGFGFLGLTFGILMSAAGFSFFYPMLMSLLIFGGSIQFVAVGLMTASFAPAETLALALMINARHIFYGISMLDRYKGMGWKKFYLIFGLCDETFSINYTAEIPSGVDKGKFYFCVTLLNHLYWVVGSTVGGIFGTLIPFSTDGIDFVMTAMFVVIFMEQWIKEKNHIPSILGIILSLSCLLLFSADSFIIPAMIVLLLGLTLLRGSLSKERGEK
jgi:4-azaleucine resistance transporter AzlC